MSVDLLNFFELSITIIAFFAFSMYYRSYLYVITTHVTVCVCHTEIKGYFLTYLLTSYLSPKPIAVLVGVSLYSVLLMHGTTAYHQKQISGHGHLSDRFC